MSSDSGAVSIGIAQDCSAVCISDGNGRKGHPMPEGKLGHSAPELWRTACPRDERLQLRAAFGRSLWVRPQLGGKAVRQRALEQLPDDASALRGRQSGGPTRHPAAATPDGGALRSAPQILWAGA